MKNCEQVSSYNNNTGAIFETLSSFEVIINRKKPKRLDNKTLTLTDLVPSSREELI